MQGPLPCQKDVSLPWGPGVPLLPEATSATLQALLPQPASPSPTSRPLPAPGTLPTNFAGGLFLLNATEMLALPLWSRSCDPGDRSASVFASLRNHQSHGSWVLGAFALMWWLQDGGLQSH